MAKYSIAYLTTFAAIAVGGLFLVDALFFHQATQIDLETAKELAQEEAKSDPDISYSPNYVSDSTLEDPRFEDYYFLYVWGPLGHTQHTPYAVSGEGVVYKLPGEFNGMVRERDIELANGDEAREFLEFYLEFQIILPGTDRHLILTEILDIPGIEEQEEIINQYQSRIEPMSIRENPNGWTFDFYTWRSVSGILFHWDVTVTKNGKIEINELEELERNTGDYFVME